MSCGDLISSNRKHFPSFMDFAFVLIDAISQIRMRKRMAQANAGNSIQNLLPLLPFAPFAPPSETPFKISEE